MNDQKFLNRYLPILLVLLNALLKIVFIESRAIANDEPFSIFTAQMDLPAILAELAPGNNPPLYEILLHGWIQLFGIGPFAVRFLPYIFSCLTVFFVYKIGLRFFTIQVALVASLLFTFSNYHIYFSHESRVYSLFALLATISMYVFMSLLEAPRNTRFKILLVVLNLLLLYAHFFGFFILFVQLLSVLLIQEARKDLLRSYLLLTFITMVGFAPYIKLGLERFLVTARKGTWLLPPEGRFEDLYNMLWTFSNAPVTTVFFIGLLVAGALLVFVRKKGKTITTPQIVVMFWFLPPFLLMYFISFKIPMFLDRYLVFMTPAFYLLTGISIQVLIENTKVRTGLACLAVLLMVISCKPNVENKRHVREMVEKIKELKTDPGCIVYICPEWFDKNFAYYYKPSAFAQKTAAALKQSLRDDNIYTLYSKDDIDTNRIKKAPGVIYLDARGAGVAENGVLAFLAAALPLKTSNPFPEIFTVYSFGGKK